METQVLVQGFRLSPQQKRLWTFQQQNAAYQAKCAVLLEGDRRKDTHARSDRAAWSGNDVQ
jgi:hypothetical protein